MNASKGQESQAADWRSSISSTSPKDTTHLSKEQQATDLPQASPTDVDVVEDKFAEDNYQPKSLRFWLTVTCNFLALFLVALDRSIVATAIPQISDHFDSLGDIGWYGSAYMLTGASCMLIFGRIYRFYSLRWSYLTCIMIFEVGSILCAAAPSSPVFIVGRAIAGLGAAGIMTGAMLVIVPMVPLHKRPVFQATFGLLFGLSSVVGPLIGGAFTTNVSWRWCFWVNVPIGGFAMVFLFLFLRFPEKAQPPASIRQQFWRLDPLGTFCFLPAVISLIMALQWGGATYAWSNWRIILLFVIFGVFLIAFAVVQVRFPETASVPVRVIAQRSILAGNIFMFCTGGGMMTVIYYIPLWFQTTHGASAIDSGVYLLPLVVGIIFGSILSGGLTQRLGYYVPFMIACASLMTIGEGLLTTLKSNSGHSEWIGYQFLVGFGLGLGMQLASLAIQAILPNEDIPTGTAIMFFCQQIGGAIFTSVGQTILSNALASKLSKVEGLNASKIAQSGATDLAKMVPDKYLDLVIEAYNYACTRIFFLSMGLSLAALVCAMAMEWKNIKKDKPKKGNSTGEEVDDAEEKNKTAEEAV